MATVNVRLGDGLGPAGVSAVLVAAGHEMVEENAQVTLTPMDAMDDTDNVIVMLEPGVVTAVLLRDLLGRDNVRGVVSYASPTWVIPQAVDAVTSDPDGLYVDPCSVMRRLAAELWTGQRMGGLTGRQNQVAELAADGLTNRQIAAHIGISIETVKSHLGAACQALGATDRLDLPRFYCSS